MSTNAEHRLIGLEPDNLLAFLALLGAMRALETARPNWRPRVHWDVDHPPVRPILKLAEPVTVDSVLEAMAAGCDVLARDYEFGGQKGINWTQSDARALLLEAIETGPDHRHRADMFAALMSDIAVKDDETVMPTPLCLLFGQGHQHFLERLTEVPKQASAPPRGRGKKAISPTAEETLAEAVFKPWERIDPSPSFRWDPEEDRRYALRFDDPSQDKGTTVHGANRLAVIGLPLLTVVPTTMRGRVRLAMIGSSQNASGETQITWPIWTRSMSLDGIRTLLAHRLLRETEPDRARLRAMGIHELRRATRISVGKFLNFTRATALSLHA